eukprot:gb/GECG01002070.1/.p1 GENE.gb/GECG01002070.1/~~gb/GECG01002070.1/.p1  ORF type:complete len:223 (+),score=51.26 gb/GECG01002070.1/:1-669(+)
MPRHRKHHRDDGDDDERAHKHSSSSSKKRSSRHSSKKKKRSRSKSESSSDRSRSPSHERSKKSSRRGEENKNKQKKKSKSSHSTSRSRKERSTIEGEGESSEATAPKDVSPISRDDYFLKNPEFRVWLKKAKDIVFDDLDAAEAREYFQTFVEKWNTGKLPNRYYSGSVDAAFEKENRTRHQWNFAKKLTEDEKLKLDSTKDSVFSSTRRSDELQKAELAGE